MNFITQVLNNMAFHVAEQRVAAANISHTHACVYFGLSVDATTNTHIARLSHLTQKFVATKMRSFRLMHQIGVVKRVCTQHGAKKSVLKFE